MKNIHLIFLILLLGSFTACIPDPVDIEVPQAEPQLVVNSQMFLDQVLLISVGRSFGALEFSQSQSDTLADDLLSRILVDSAVVILSTDTFRDTLPGFGGGLYVSTEIPLIVGQTYTLEVQDTINGEQVFAENEVLEPVGWDQLDYLFVRETFDFADSVFTDTVLRLFLGFNDLPDENYYMVNAYQISQNTIVNGPDFSENLIGGESQPVFSYSDQLYTDPLIQDTLDLTQFNPGDTVAITLSHISPQYYQYLTTRDRSGTSIFVSLLGEPVSYPSNVIGGYGMFNLHVPTVRILILN